MDSTSRSIQLVSEAAQAHREGRLDLAERLVKDALQWSPADIQAQLLLGVILVKTQRPQEAVELLTYVANSDPSSFFARYWLSVAFRLIGRLDDAIVVGYQTLRLNPDDVQVLLAVGSCLIDLGRFDEAGPIFTRAVRLAGKDFRVHEGLALALQGVGKEVEAIQALRVAFQLAPQSESVGLRLGAMLLERQEFDAAESAARTILLHQPNSSKAHALLARALMDQNQGIAAREHSQAAVTFTPIDAPALVVHGSVLQNLGEIKAAETFFRRAIQIEPKLCHAYFSLVHNRKVTLDVEPILHAMTELEQDPAIPEVQQVHLQYALGKAHHDLANFRLAMEHYDRANRLAHSLRFQDRTYNRQAHQAGFEFVQSTLTHRFLAANRSKNESDLPIFVVGMMRSGTTLVEQILSSHSEVGASGEQRFWPLKHSEVLRPDARFDHAAAGRLGREYVQQLRSISEKGRFVVDKMPVNYAFLGVIHAALPNARFIHVQRHPVDTCLSIYFTPNRSRIEWAHDKSNMTFAYRQYLKMMSHWSQVLPADRLLHVQYRDLVLNQEQTTRQILDFCGLDWEEKCLYPEQNDRLVLTPSVWQVRQPVYTSSLDRWRHYEPWLGAFAELL